MFPGSAAQWNGLTGMTDARILARHLQWAATPAAGDEALNVVNGDVFRWIWMWSRLAKWFGIEPGPFQGQGIPLERQLADGDLGRPIKVVTDIEQEPQTRIPGLSIHGRRLFRSV